jgi:hypothetical protein
MDQTPTAMTSDFKSFLKQEYSYDSQTPVCSGDYASFADVQTDEQKRMTGMRDSKKRKVIETGWKYASVMRSLRPAPRPHHERRSQTSAELDLSPDTHLQTYLGRKI